MADEKVIRPAKPTKPYRLKTGCSHGLYKEGDTVQLTDTQAVAFADKFEKAEAPPTAAPKPPTPPAPSGPSKPADPGAAH